MSEVAKKPYSLATARGQIRILPELDGMLHIWGGEGEADPPADPPEGPEGAAVDPPEDPEDPDGEDPEDKSKDGKKSLEDQLDEEKRARIKAEKALAKKDREVADAEADKDAVKDRDRYKAKLEARDKFLSENLLVMEIQKQTKFNFIDVDDVVTLIQKKFGDEVTIDLEADIPTVDGLDLALKRIAKDKPHFLKQPDGADGAGDGTPPPPSGGKAGGGNLGSQEAEDERLGKKFKIPGYGTNSVRLM